MLTGCTTTDCAVWPPVFVTVTGTVGMGKLRDCWESGKVAGDGLTDRLAGAGGPGGKHPALRRPTVIAAAPSPARTGRWPHILAPSWAFRFGWLERPVVMYRHSGSHFFSRG